MMDSKMTRRDLLVTTGTVALAGWVSTEGAAAAAIGTTPLAFVDGLLSPDELALSQRELGSQRPEILQRDLVWQWRGELRSRLARGGRLIAVTRWDKALLFNELAREARFVIRQDRIAGSLFRTVIRAS